MFENLKFESPPRHRNNYFKYCYQFCFNLSFQLSLFCSSFKCILLYLVIISLSTIHHSHAFYYSYLGIIVCPSSLITNWAREMKKWLPTTLGRSALFVTSRSGSGPKVLYRPSRNTQYLIVCQSRTLLYRTVFNYLFFLLYFLPRYFMMSDSISYDPYILLFLIILVHLFIHFFSSLRVSTKS